MNKYNAMYTRTYGSVDLMAVRNITVPVPPDSESLGVLEVHGQLGRVMESCNTAYSMIFI